MLADFPFIFRWWLLFFLIGLVNLPLTVKIFGKFVDKGYIFAKILGILLVSYLIWLLGSLKILPFSQLNSFLVVCLLLIVNLLLFRNRRRTAQGMKTDRTPYLLFILEEFLFFLTLTFWSYIRGFAPDIRGLEKFMDFGFVNSILSGKYFPPLDLWLAKSPEFANGHFINYYYFGHLVTAVLTKLSGIDSAVVYNLMVAVLFAFTFTGSFSLGFNLFFRASRNLKSAVACGLLAGFLVALAGNLHTIYLFTKGYPNEQPVPFWQILSSFNPQTYWYPNATRFIPYTIHEFPIYSFVVSDLHGHVLDIPFVLLIIAFLLSLAFAKNQPPVSPPLSDTQNQDLSQLKVGNLGFRILFLGFLLAVLYMTNATDGLVYFALSGLVIFWITRQLKISSIILFVLGVLLVLLSLPFSVHFRPFVKGIALVTKDRSPLWMLPVLWGFFYFHAIGFLVFLKKRSFLHSPSSDSPSKTTVSLSFLGIRITVDRPSGNEHRQNTSPGPLLSSDIFVLILIFLSTFLLIFPEIAYFKDIYPLHYRANTMFKLGYQAFMMLSIAAAYIIFRLNWTLKPLRRLLALNFDSSIFYFLFSIFLLFLVSVYPYFAVKSYYGDLKNYQGLNGTAWLKKQYPDDFAGIFWLKRGSAGSQFTILEAVGDSYTDYGRVSVHSGLPTVLGWPVHEWLWRGSYDEAGKRVTEAGQIFESADLETTKKLLKKYDVKYVFLGALEKEKYPNLNEVKFQILGKKVFQSGETKIYSLFFQPPAENSR